LTSSTRLWARTLNRPPPQAKAKAWQQTQRERLADHEAISLAIIDISADHQPRAVLRARAIARIVWCSRGLDRS